MEHVQKLLLNAAKLEELELQRPELEARYAELKETVSNLKYERDWAILTAKNLEDPGFFQRLLGKVAEKQEKAQAEARQASAAYEGEKRELDKVEQQLTCIRENHAALSDASAVYAQARAVFLADADSERKRRLQEMETEAFRPVAVECLRKIRDALYAARGWMRKDIQPRHGAVVTRRMEFLHLADAYAEKLQALLIYFPEGSITLGASMTEPSTYIHSVSMNLSQIDYLNIAIEQSQRVQAQLEAL